MNSSTPSSPISAATFVTCAMSPLRTTGCRSGSGSSAQEMPYLNIMSPHPMYMPPLTSSNTPVTKAASSEAR